MNKSIKLLIYLDLIITFILSFKFSFIVYHFFHFSTELFLVMLSSSVNVSFIKLDTSAELTRMEASVILSCPSHCEAQLCRVTVRHNWVESLSYGCRKHWILWVRYGGCWVWCQVLAGTKFSLKLLLYSDDIPIITKLISSLCMVLSLNNDYVFKF